MNKLKRRIFFLVILYIPILCNSQDLDYAKHIIKKLASPELGGRGYVNEGDRKSADFIAAEYRKLGLESIYTTSYFQKFSISINTFPSKINMNLNGKDLVPGKDYLIEASSPSIKGKFPVIVISRDQIDTKVKTDALIAESGNSFILIDCRGKKNEPEERAKIIEENISFLKYSPEHNIKGVIIYDDEKLTWEASTFQTSRPVCIISGNSDPTSIKSIEITVEARFIQNYETRNVTGFIKGTSCSDSVIIVTAHYDHLGKMGKETYFPGANDNASGVAMILNLAKYYAVNKPRYTILFVALGAEEAGLLGAKAFTENPPLDLKKIRFLVNFDLAGTGDNGIRVVNGSVFRDKFDLLKNINAREGLLPDVVIRGAACNSDHCLFYKKGVPCFYIYTLGGISAYHDINDRYETLPLTEFSDYCKLMIEFLKRI
ncbi:MAG TPA: M28 family peptidase [Bacteroidales bacterium]|nr:M28 family peptidase [Bacteroidales bacterium]